MKQTIVHAGLENLCMGLVKGELTMEQLQSKSFKVSTNLYFFFLFELSKSIKSLDDEFHKR